SRSLKPWMYPSSWRMRAISTFSRDAGISTRVCFALTALRSRVSISAIGSVISLFPAMRSAYSPAALGHAGHVAVEGELPETQAAQRELPHVRKRTAAQAAPVAQADLELRRLRLFRDLSSGGHISSCRLSRLKEPLSPLVFPERHADELQQL